MYIKYYFIQLKIKNPKKHHESPHFNLSLDPHIAT